MTQTEIMRHSSVHKFRKCRYLRTVTKINLDIIWYVLSVVFCTYRIGHIVLLWFFFMGDKAVGIKLFKVIIFHCR